MQRKREILGKEESESKWEEDVQTAIEEVISKTARTKEARSSLRDLIASITIEEPAVAKHVQAATQQTLTKFPVTAPWVSSKRKGAQSSKGATALEKPEHKRTKQTKPKAIEPSGTPLISLTQSKKKKQLAVTSLGSPKEHL